MSTPDNVPALYMSRKELRNSTYYKFLNHPIFREVGKLNDEDHLDIIIELEKWEPPKQMQDVFSYKFAGYDSENRPIWIVRLGTCPIKEIIEQGQEQMLERYFWQAMHWVAKSIVAKTPEECPSQQAVFIVDAKRVSKGILHVTTLGFMLRMAKRYKDSSLLMSGLGIGVNMNKFGVIIMNLMRPIIRQTLQNIELYGKDESTWQPRLAEIFGKNEMPNFEGTERTFYRVLIKPEK